MIADPSERIQAMSATPAWLPLFVWLLLGWGLIGANGARADEEIKFDAVWEGEFVAVSASADLLVDVATVWSVLLDYDRFAEFIPDMVSSRVVSRSGEGMVVEQRGEFGFLFFRQPVHLVLDVVLEQPRRMLARSIAGDLRELASSFDIDQTAQGLRLRYSARFLPAAPLPPLIGLAIVRHQMKKQFAAMVQEMIRRGARTDAMGRTEAQR